MSDAAASRIRIVRGDITTLAVGAIVNAANSSLLGGGGVDGAIHRAAGQGLAQECRRLGGCPTGEARLTGAYDLSSRFVIHAVGPVYRGGDAGEASLLRSAYERSLELAAEASVESVAFPCISAGIYGYPRREACDIAVTAVCEWLETHDLPGTVVFCCYSDEDVALYRARVERVIRPERRAKARRT